MKSKFTSETAFLSPRFSKTPTIAILIFLNLENRFGYEKQFYFPNVAKTNYSQNQEYLN